MDVLVTGATSNVGAEIALSLRQLGHRVRAIALPGLPRDHLDAAGIPLDYVDVTDEDGLARRAEGCEAVIHCAAAIDFYERGRARSFAVNVGGARACARAARRAGARRLVHMSSCGVYGILRGRERVDERTPTRATGFAYNDSKREGEVAVRAEAGALGLTILRLAGVYGRFDRINLPPTARALERGIYVYFGNRYKPHNLVGTPFVAEAVARLLEEPPPPTPETWIACEGDPPPYHAFVETIAEALGLEPPRLTLPAPATLLLGRLFDAADRAGLPRPSVFALPSALAANSLIDATYDGSALRARLGLAPVDTLAEVRRATLALRAAGRL